MARLEWIEQAGINIGEDEQYLQALEYAFDMADYAQKEIPEDRTAGVDAPDTDQQGVDNTLLNGNHADAHREVPDAHSVPAQSLAPDSPALAEDAGYAPLPNSTIILSGRYRLIQLLHASPRLHLYLGRRLPLQSHTTSYDEDRQPLVAIRELVLHGLTPAIQRNIEKAAFEEFVSPAVFGSPRLPGTGDRIRIENNRHYLVMQLRPTRGARQAVAITLAELLLSLRQWPAWLDTQTALTWGVQLCRIVARLHRMGAVLGNLTPATILVDSNGAAEWAPVLLVSWSPPLQFWSPTSRALRSEIFPLAENTLSPEVPFCAFAAPETFEGRCDERSDVYALGAILYLLLTRYAPVSAPLRLNAEQKRTQTGAEEHRPGSDVPRHLTGAHVHGAAPASVNSMALVPPHLFNDHITSRLEHILQRALDLNPAWRFPTVFAMVEALETIDLKSEMVVHSNGTRKLSPMEKVIEWFRKDSID